MVELELKIKNVADEIFTYFHKGPSVRATTGTAMRIVALRFI
jgi:hypothetical protein